MDNNGRENEMTALSGTVSSVVYANGETGYTVLRLRTDEGVQTVVGHFFAPAAGERMHLTGRWTSHPSYGKQFTAETFERELPTGGVALLQYLASGVIKGIGPSLAAAIVEKFGNDALDIIASTPEELAQVRGISAQRAAEIGRDFAKKAGMRQVMELLSGHQVRPQLAVRLWQTYGSAAADAVRDNPYILTQEHIGGQFFEADRLALDMGFEGDAPCRVEAAVLFELQHNTTNGHTFLPREKLSAATQSLIGVTAEDVEEAIQSLADGGLIFIDTVGGLEACYLEELFRAECDLARRMSSMASFPRVEPRKLRTELEAIQHRRGIRYNALQLEAVTLAAGCRIMALTGGPGTGKTTAIRGILDVFDMLGLKTVLAAPTGRAAKRMAELTGREAMTVHRLLGAGYSEDETRVVFSKNESDQLDAQAVILDEASMADVSLMAALMAAMPLSCRLVMVGDADQLPSVGPGNVFSDVIRSGVIPTVKLTEIFRQAQDSAIIRCAHGINAGSIPADFGGDMFFLRRSQPAQIAQTAQQLFSKRLPENMGIPWQQIQVLTPSRKGEAGTVELNRALQAAVNPAAPDKREVAWGKYIFREGDRVMQIRNNYDLLWRRQDGVVGAGVFNGDTGTITGVDTDEQMLAVAFDDRTAVYSFDMLGELEPAYAVTVHKAQGSEFRAVILVLGSQAPALCNRRVLYTAVTRAKELLVMVGEQTVMEEMVRNDRRLKRYSGLKLRLEDERRQNI